ncbi:MAG: hypothetical protein LBT12_07300 [Oscillospiraceae bacterium]|jgi:hypothetical protein|nr:hypothetical protein [Oscillospiraceae bacterium]
MEMTALLDLMGRYADGKVTLKWRYPPGAPECVHIYPAQRAGDRFLIARDKHMRVDLKDAQTGWSFDYNVAGGGVKARLFCVYLAAKNEIPPDDQLLVSREADFVVTVSIGRAHILYSLSEKQLPDGLSAHFLRLQTSAEIEFGVLGYAWDFNGLRMAAPLPGSIHPGKHMYPAFYLPTGLYPAVELVGGANSDVTIAEGKVSFGLFSKIKLSKKKN